MRGTLVSPFGQRWGRLHRGIDIAAPAGTAIAASASGQVVYAGAMSGYGLMVVIQHAGGIATAYAHNSSISVSVGQSVGQGQTIAAVGCTGHCFGDHVHFEVRVGGGKTDALDAVRAARHVLRSERPATPRAGGERQALQALVAAREGAVNAKRAGLCQLRDLLITTPEAAAERAAAAHTSAAAATPRSNTAAWPRRRRAARQPARAALDRQTRAATDR